MRETERLIEALRRRIEAFERGNPEPVEADEADDEARQLLHGSDRFAHDEQARSVMLPADASLVLAQVYWYRYRRLGRAADHRSCCTAKRWGDRFWSSLQAAGLRDHGERNARRGSARPEPFRGSGASGRS